MDAQYVIWNYRAADFPALLQLLQEAENHTPQGRPVTPRGLEEKLSHPYHVPEEDIFLLAAAGKPAGYLVFFPEIQIGRAIVEYWIRPELHDSRIPKDLLATAEMRAQVLSISRLNINTDEDDTSARETLEALGFTIVRRAIEMSLDIRGYDPGALLDNVQCRHLTDKEHGLLADLQNRAFEDHWGYNPNTPETIAHSTGLSRCTRDDVILVIEDGHVGGYCWNCLLGNGRGRILMLGIDPKNRRRGLGRRVLAAGLVHLKGQGVTRAELTVDSENHSARRLYRAFGFLPGSQSYCYERPVAAAKAGL
ncbi:GNAT family N-acetyltransferase [Chloroflexota bacterium]